MNEKRNLSCLSDNLRMVAWEVTRSCNLACLHCRASSLCGPYIGELDTSQGKRLLEEIAAFSRPVIILTGGEPLLRADIFELAAFGAAKGLRMALATNGIPVDEIIACKMIDSGIQRVSVSIDGAKSASHDEFRGVSGAFDGAKRGIDALKKAGMEFQINTTINQRNLNQLSDILDLAEKLGAVAHHIFLLVPTGRGKGMADQAITPEQYEQTLLWLHEQSMSRPIQMKITCAPHYYRIIKQNKETGKRAGNMPGEKIEGQHPLHTVTRGCLGGSAFCFVSHTGQVQPCGYLEIDCGQFKEKGFEEIWKESGIFRKLRDLNLYEGKCGRCEFIRVCGGCRARAFEITGNYLAEEPFCTYEPGD